jgi:sec-independent protein translocase protein TatA
MASNEIMQAAVGPWQVIVILAIVLLLFGGKKIPELMKGLGKGIKEFKDASKGDAPAETPADNNNKIEAKS